MLRSVQGVVALEPYLLGSAVQLLPTAFSLVEPPAGIEQRYLGG